MKRNNCKNCDTEFEGNYCFNCSQAAAANERLRFTNTIEDFFDNTFNLHKGFFFTFWKLIINPREVLSSYIQGSQKKIHESYTLFCNCFSFCWIFSILAKF